MCEIVSGKKFPLRLRSCIIVTTKQICNVDKLFNLLNEKGLDEFEVRQVGGNQFVLVFDREELVSQCLRWEWMWLADVFSDIKRWHKNFSPDNRVAWVAIQGVPLYAWNTFTFSNIVNKLGELLLLEDEDLLGSDFSFKRAKILTNQLNFIEETFDLSCEGEVFSVHVREFNFSVWSNLDLVVLNEEMQTKGKVDSVLDSICSSESSSRVQSFQQGVNEVHGGDVEEPTDLKNLPSLEVEGETTAGKRKIKVTPEVDFLNVGFISKANTNERRLRDIAGLEEVGGVLGADVHDYSPGVGTNLNDPISRASVETYTSSDNAHGEEIENVQVDGSLCEMDSRDNNNISWAEGVDRAMNAKNGWTGVAFDHALESDNLDFFPEFKYTRNRKKYASLYDLQDKVLSAKEKKIRDRSFKEIKNSKKVVKEVDLNESSPSESDIVRTQALIRSEKNTLEFGKKLGFQFIGNEDDVIMDMVNLEFQNRD
ncbi:hypothetical protein V6N13_133871 [Hibiscus sabdariffa]